MSEGNMSQEGEVNDSKLRAANFMDDVRRYTNIYIIFRAIYLGLNILERPTWPGLLSRPFLCAEQPGP